MFCFKFNTLTKGNYIFYNWVYHGFRQAKFAYGVSILGSSQFTLHTTPAASKNNAWFKSGQNQLINNQLASLI